VFSINLLYHDINSSKTFYCQIYCTVVELILWENPPEVKNPVYSPTKVFLGTSHKGLRKCIINISEKYGKGVKKIMKYFLRNILIVIIVSLIFQGLWEYWVCGTFYAMDDTNSTEHLLLMVSATFGDMVMSVILFCLLAVLNKNSNWLLHRWSSKDRVIMILYALFLSFYFEISALDQGRWVYSDFMPLVLESPIGLVPVLQLLILFPLTFLVSSYIIRYYSKPLA